MIEPIHSMDLQQLKTAGLASVMGARTQELPKPCIEFMPAFKSPSMAIEWESLAPC